MGRYLFTVVLRNPNFVISDLIACARYYHFSIEFDDPSFRIGASPNTDYIAATLPSDQDAIHVAKRSISVKSVSVLLGDGLTAPDLYSSCASSTHNLNDGSFAVQVQNHNRKLTDDLRRDHIRDLVSSLHLTSPVDLKHPDHLIYLSLEYPQQGPLELLHLYCSVHLSEGNSQFPDKFPLPRRPFINKTSMEPALALYSAVHGLVGPGTISFDPFCGSGSLLVGIASLGGCVLGSDFDLPSMFQSDDRSIFGNFTHYQMSDKLLGLFRADFMNDNFRPNTLFDAIVTDPPYGIREKCRADGTSPLLPLLLKLYAFGAKYLKLGGRLVYWLPCGYDIKIQSQLPVHPALKLVSHCQQDLGSRYCRVLVTLEKVSNAEGEVQFADFDASWLKVRDLVFSPVDGFRGKNRREKRKFTKEFKARLHHLDKPDQD
jgi:tRNA (guanine10-N2)-methyltransferase